MLTGCPAVDAPLDLRIVILVFLKVILMLVAHYVIAELIFRSKHMWTTQTMPSGHFPAYLIYKVLRPILNLKIIKVVIRHPFHHA